MSSKKLEAKKAFLEKLSGKNRDESYEGIGKALEGKKLSKVTVAAPDKEGLKKGLTLAQKLMKAKYGEEESEEKEELCSGCECSPCECEESEEEEYEEE